MSIRKIMTLAGLALAVAALMPTSALAEAGGTDRPVAISVSATTVFNQTTLAVSYQGTDLGSHIGLSTLEGTGQLIPTGPGTFSYSDSGVTTTANGDELFVSQTGTVTTTPDGSEIDAVLTFTGGTGRFEGASGTATGTIHNVLQSSTGTESTFKTDASLAGTISY